MSSPHVAVVVLTWNGEDDTLACLASLGRVEYDNLSVVVVDNGSADRTVLRVRTEFPEVAVLETGANLGFAAGNNVGIRHALDRGADYVFLLNNDTEVDPELIRHLVDAAERDASAGVLGPKVFFFSHRDRLWYGGGWVQRWAGASGHIALGELDRNGSSDPVETDYVTGCALMARASVLRQVGFLEPAFFIYWEDVDLSVRIRRAGYRALYVPKAVLWHKVSRAYGGSADYGFFYGGRPHGPESGASLYLGTRNNFLFIERNVRWPFRVLVMGIALGRKLAKMLALVVTMGAPGRRKARAIALGIRDYVLRRFGPPSWDVLHL
jgi:GT2 family glycosyltransferase